MGDGLTAAQSDGKTVQRLRRNMTKRKAVSCFQFMVLKSLVAVKPLSNQEKSRSWSITNHQPLKSINQSLRKDGFL